MNKLTLDITKRHEEYRGKTYAVSGKIVFEREIINHTAFIYDEHGFECAQALPFEIKEILETEVYIVNYDVLDYDPMADIYEIINKNDDDYIYEMANFWLLNESYDYLKEILKKMFGL